MKCPNCFRQVATKDEVDTDTNDRERCWATVGGECWADESPGLVRLAAGDGAKPEQTYQTATGKPLKVYWVQRGDTMHRITAGTLDYAMILANGCGDNFILWGVEQ